MISKDSEVVYLDTDGDKTHYLLNPLEVERFACALIDINGKLNNNKLNKNDQLFLCSDICKDVVVGSIKLPVLRQLFRNSYGSVLLFNHIVWLKVIRPTITSIRLYICNEKGKIVSFDKSWLQCTLLFIPPKR